MLLRFDQDLIRKNELLQLRCSGLSDKIDCFGFFVQRKTKLNLALLRLKERPRSKSEVTGGSRSRGQQ